jgi:hypothetical protein
MRLQTFLLHGIVTLSTVTAIRPPTFTIWALSDMKDKAIVEVKRGAAYGALNMSSDRIEEDNREEACIGEDYGMEWRNGPPPNCSNKPRWKAIGWLGDLIIDQTQEIRITMPDYTLSVSPVSRTPITSSIELILRCNVTAPGESDAFWLIGFGFATDTSLKAKVVCRNGTHAG